MKKLLLPMLCAGLMCGNAWAGVVPGEGTAASPYVITTAADWNAVADDMDKQYDAGADTLYPGAVFKLAADIDFAGVAMKPWALNMPFDGVLDGGNFTVKGYSINAGKMPYFAPIGWMGPNSEVKNITMAGTVASDTTYVGGLVGSCEGTLRNVKHAGIVKGNYQGARITTVSATGATSVSTIYGSVGGLVGMALPESKYYNCVNTGLVDSKAGRTGGIIGEGSYGLVVSGCENNGTVDVEVEYSTAMLGDYVGGVAGYVEQSTFTNCTNNGQINTTTSRYVGGILGYGLQSVAGYWEDQSEKKVRGYIFRFINCVNNSDITAYARLGGIYSGTGSNASYSMAYVQGCHNHGNLTLTYNNKTANTEGVGGICFNLGRGCTYRDCTNTGNIRAMSTNYVCGLFGGTAGNPSTPTDGTTGLSVVTNVINCHNYGDVTVTYAEGSTSGGNMAAGVVSMGRQYINLDSCSNTGNITSVGYNVGGVMGSLSGVAKVEHSVKNCWNTGNITAGFGGVGGVIGSMSTTRMVEMSNCWNAGNISTLSTTGGTSAVYYGVSIGGVVGAHCGLMQNCYNVGNVTGASRVGGVIGAPTKIYSTVLNCYNAGKIDAPADSCGSIVGVRLIKNGSVWTEGNAMINCYYVTDYGTYANDVNGGEESGTPVSMAKLCKAELGDAFTSPGDNCMPVLTQFAKEQNAQFYSAAVVPATGDTYAKITKDFGVGTPDGTVWSASNPTVAFNGNAVHLADFIDEDVVLTAKLGDLSKEVKVHITGGTSGVDAVSGDAAAEVVAESWYGMDGRAMAKPAAADGSAYVVVQKLADGTTRTVKVVNK